MGKPAKQDEKKKSIKNDPTSVQQLEVPVTPLIIAKEEPPQTAPDANQLDLQQHEAELKSSPDVIVEPEVKIEYKEPELTYLVVKEYEGGKERGLFEGNGKAIYYEDNFYEGEFHEGMMHGRGKYTWSNGTTFEGDFVNNEINGCGVYNWPDKAIYEGEVRQGKRHGFGTFKSLKHSVTYTGEWVSGKRYGKGKILYDSEGMSYYEGDWIDNKKYGWGLRRYPTGNIYEGMWVNDIRHGVGTMRWINKNQIYIGHWENGIQNGLGEHHWYLQRILKTQYALRNTYYGSFKNGKRHGKGTFSYANGSKYEGDWCDNFKHGYGKFTFKNGKSYEGWFEEDKMTNNPSFNRTSKFASDIARVETRIPSAGVTLDLESLNRLEIMDNKFEETFLDLNDLIDDFPFKKQSIERDQAEKTIRRYLENLTNTYRFYSQLGLDSSPDNTYVLSRLQFWRFMKDCEFHADNRSICEFDRLLSSQLQASELHNPFDKILMRDFLNYLVILAYNIYHDELEDQAEFLISACTEKLIIDKILPNSCKVKGIFYKDPRKTSIALNYLIKCHEVYKFVSTKRERSPYDSTLKMRDFIHLLNDYKLLNQNNLTTKVLVSILASDNLNVYDSTNDSYNLEFELCFLEFFEALVSCALENITDQNMLARQSRQSTIVTREHSFLSQVSCKTNTDKNQDEQMTSQTHIGVKSSTGNKDLSKISSENENESNINEEIAEKKDTANVHLNVNQKSKTKSSNKEKEIEIWLQKLEYFFMLKFFPAADYSQFIKKEINKSL